MNIKKKYNIPIAYVVSPAPSYVWEHLIPLYNIAPGKFVHLENVSLPHPYPQFENAKELNVTIEKINIIKGSKKFNESYFYNNYIKDTDIISNAPQIQKKNKLII